MFAAVLNTWRSLLEWKWPVRSEIDALPLASRATDEELIRNRLELISMSRHYVRHRLVQNWIRDYGDIPEDI